MDKKVVLLFFIANAFAGELEPEGSGSKRNLSIYREPRSVDGSQKMMTRRSAYKHPRDGVDSSPQAQHHEFMGETKQSGGDNLMKQPAGNDFMKETVRDKLMKQPRKSGEQAINVDLSKQARQTYSEAEYQVLMKSLGNGKAPKPRCDILSQQKSDGTPLQQSDDGAPMTLHHPNPLLDQLINVYPSNVRIPEELVSRNDGPQNLSALFTALTSDYKGELPIHAKLIKPYLDEILNLALAFDGDIDETKKPSLTRSNVMRSDGMPQLNEFMLAHFEPVRRGLEAIRKKEGMEQDFIKVQVMSEDASNTTEIVSPANGETESNVQPRRLWNHLPRGPLWDYYFMPLWGFWVTIADFSNQNQTPKWGTWKHGWKDNLPSATPWIPGIWCNKELYMYYLWVEAVETTAVDYSWGLGDWHLNGLYYGVYLDDYYDYYAIYRAESNYFFQEGQDPNRYIREYYTGNAIANWEVVMCQAGMEFDMRTKPAAMVLLTYNGKLSVPNPKFVKVCIPTTGDGC